MKYDISVNEIGCDKKILKWLQQSKYDLGMHEVKV